MADAPLVVQELQNSLDELGAAMDATEQYITHSEHLIRDLLPRLNHALASEDALKAEELESQLQDMDRGRAHTLAERALREAADAEIEALLGGDA